MTTYIRRLSILFSLFFCLFSHNLSAQQQDHDHEHHSHKHPLNEIGIGNYLSYLAGEHEFAYSLHVHLLRFFEDSRFGAGLGYEQIFDEHRHRSLTMIGAFRLSHPLVLTLGPGILFGNEENPGNRFTVHAELVYEFEIGHFHLGPALDFATTFDEYHIGAGLHVAFAF